MLVGTAVTQQGTNDLEYVRVSSSEFNQIQPENEMKWTSLHPAEGRFSFAAADQLVNLGLSNRQAVRGHVLVGEAPAPAWLTQRQFSGSQFFDVVEQHIKNVVGRYAGKVYAWDVVNEAFEPTGALRNSVWFGGKGMPLIEQAFRWAHQADPRALLFYNDTAAEVINPQSDAIYAMAKEFLARGVPLHGIGFQMHLDASGVPLDRLEANLKRFADLGLQIQITELDVALKLGPDGKLEANALAQQAAVYHGVVSTCLKFKACSAVQVWGFTDKYSWIPTFFPGNGAALPFDASYRVKPAYYSLLKALDPAAPALLPGSVLNNASYQAGPVAPGEAVIVFPSSTGPSTKSSIPVNGQYPTMLADTQVLFDGVPAPILQVNPDSVVVIVPYEVAGKQETRVVYRYGVQESNAVYLPVAAAVPGLFTTNFGSGPVIAGRPSNVLVSRVNPATAGETIILYYTGGGRLVSGSAGTVVPHPAPPMLLPATVTIDGVPATVVATTGVAGESAGLAQVTLQVPRLARSGDVPVQVWVAGQSSKGATLLPVKGSQ